MLGQPVSMLIPRVVGFKLTGEIPAGATATDVVLTITEMLRKHGVVGKFVEFYGEGVGAVPLANRATIGNMSPEFGSTAAMFPIDDVTCDYLRLTGRSDAQVALVEAYAKEQGLWHDPATEPVFSEYLELDLSTVVPSIAGPKRPQDRIALTDAKNAFRAALGDYVDDGTDNDVDEASKESFPASDPPASTSTTAPRRPARRRTRPPRCASSNGRPSRKVSVTMADGTQTELDHGHVAIASITSCTNTSNPSVMVAAALLAKNAVERGLSVKPWVKTSLAPGSKVVMDYYAKAGLVPVPGEARLPPGRLRLHHVHRQLRPAARGGLGGGAGERPRRRLGAVRQPQLRGPDQPRHQDELPGLAAAGRSPTRWPARWTSTSTTEPLGSTSPAPRCSSRDIWPAAADVARVVEASITKDMFTNDYADVFAGDERWRSLPTPEGDTFDWAGESTYVRKPPYFEGMALEPSPVGDVTGARVLAKLGDSVTTDHISPAGSIKPDSPAGVYLAEHGVDRKDFNSYGSRRGNHEVMIRGTFANIRLRNQLLDDVQGGFTRDFSRGGEQTTIYDAAQSLRRRRHPAGGAGRQGVRLGLLPRLGGQGHPRCSGVKAVIAESYERIHRSNLIGMGVLPLQYPEGSERRVARARRHRDVRRHRESPR